MSSAPDLIPAVAAPDAPARRGLAPVLGWGLYLGMSWTWCIGMFLPVFLVREMGTMGWVVFAIPNVVGAAAMGWVLRTRESSEALVRQHLPACWAFSLVTVCFHVFFLGWMIRRLLGDAAGLILFGAFFAFWIAGRRHFRDVATAAVVFVLSAGAFAFLLARGDLALQYHPTPAPTALLSLLPVCVLGFLLCPYLDLTFHLGRQQSPSPGAARGAFTVGFGLFFGLMIVYTLAYAGVLAPLVPTPPGRAVPRQLFTILGLHMALQAAFTIAVHLRQMESPRWSDTGFYRRMNGVTRSVVLLVAVAASVALATWSNQRPKLFDLPAGEVIYRCFMGFYGLVFPAYVLTCMLPLALAARKTAILTAPRESAGFSVPLTNVLLFLVSTLAALPFFFAGFILRRMTWLLPGAGILLLAGIIAMLLSRRTAPDAHSAGAAA